jgi:hypothetical protein
VQKFSERTKNKNKNSQKKPPWALNDTGAKGFKGNRRTRATPAQKLQKEMCEKYRESNASVFRETEKIIDVRPQKNFRNIILKATGYGLL